MTAVRESINLYQKQYQNYQNHFYIIKVNKKRCEISQVLAENDMVEMYINDEFFEIKKNTEFLTINSSLNIIYEDENILIINKPSNLEVTGQNSLTTFVHKKYSNLPFKPMPCHRLDRNTTGLVIFAKNEESLNILLTK